jgi:hypothetical protein
LPVCGWYSVVFIQLSPWLYQAQDVAGINTVGCEQVPDVVVQLVAL